MIVFCAFLQNDELETWNSNWISKDLCSSNLSYFSVFNDANLIYYPFSRYFYVCTVLSILTGRMSVLYRYAMARVVCNYALLFKEWDTLKPLTLHCILKMFHRFAFDMGYPALIAQASLFLTFKKVLQVADHRSDLKVSWACSLFFC